MMPWLCPTCRATDVQFFEEGARDGRWRLLTVRIEAPCVIPSASLRNSDTVVTGILYENVVG